MLDVSSPIGAPPAFKLQMVLREFETPDPIYITFEFPLHRVDTTGEIAAWNEDINHFARGRDKVNTTRKKDRDVRCDKMVKILEEYEKEGKVANIDEMKEKVGVCEASIRRYVKSCEEWTVDEKIIHRVKKKKN